MKKQKKQLIILLVILLVCVAGYFGATMYSSYVEVQEEIAEAEYEVLSFEDADLAQLQIEGSAGELLLTYNGSTWSFVNDIDAQMEALNGTEEAETAEAGETDAGDEEADGTQDAEEAETALYEVNTTTASTILGYLDSLTSEYQVTPNEDLSEYGLDDPSMTITLTMTDGTVYTLVFGDYNEYISAYYYYLDDADVLYTISSYTYNILNKCDTDLADEVEEEEEEDSDEEEDASDDEEGEDAEEEEDASDGGEDEDADEGEKDPDEEAEDSDEDTGDDADAEDGDDADDVDNAEEEGDEEGSE